MKKILVVSGSPKKDGNTAALIEWFSQGAGDKRAEIELIQAGAASFKASGCFSCRACQSLEEYECVVKDHITPVLKKMITADVIVLASPLYFYGASAQLKAVVDRMFSLYKWDNTAGTMKTPLKGKTLVLLGSAFESDGLDTFQRPFALTADYTGMAFESLIISDAGVSGDIRQKTGVRDRAYALGIKVAVD